MPWMELSLKPTRDWEEEGLADWAEAMGAYLVQRGKGIKISLQMLPGYQIVKFGEEQGAGELLISSAERLIVLMGLAVKSPKEREFAEILLRFAQEKGALGLRVPINYVAEKVFWQSRGAQIVPEPVPLREEIQKDKVGVKPLHKHSLMVTYKNKPALCLEPIYCTARPKGPVSMAARRLEKLLGGGLPIGFASRVSAYSPWEFERRKWDDLLAYSRLEAYEVLEKLVLESLPQVPF